MPVSFMTKEHKKVLATKCSEKQDIEMPALPESPTHNNSSTASCNSEKEAKGGDEEEGWELKRIMSIQDVTGDAPIKCSTETCLLPAACAYVSTLDPTSRWFCCLDCQVRFVTIAS